MLTCINKGKGRKFDSQPINLIYCLTNQGCVAGAIQAGVYQELGIERDGSFKLRSKEGISKLYALCSMEDP